MKVIPKKVKCVVYPLDKLNKSIWHGLKSETYSVKVEKQGSREEILVTLALRFHGEPLNAFDKRVYLAICALYNAGNEYMSAGMIYRTMGGNGRPNTKKFEKIKQSIIKMAMVHISIDNAEEANKYKYPRFREVGANLLTCEYESETEIKTRKTEYCLHLLSKPLLMRYAEEHKQVTTYTLEQFQMPLSMTELNCAMDDYFRHRIARASGNTLKIKYKSLLEHCYLTDKYARRKAKEKIPVFLDFYVKLGLIHGYSLETTEISINL
jgi:hypothetical protein